MCARASGLRMAESEDRERGPAVDVASSPPDGPVPASKGSGNLLKQNRALRPLLVTAALALMAVLALPVAALANTSDAIAQTGGMTATLPLLGSSLTVQVTLDGSGNLSTVNVDPVGTYSASKVGAHAVTFDSADGTSQVKIRAKGDKLSVKAQAGTLDALVGPGTWSADVFGTGAMSTVAYASGKASDGSPTVTIGTVDAAAGITTSTGTPTATSDKHGADKLWADKHGASASARVVFSRDGYTKTLTIRVSVKAHGKHPASLELSLSGKDRQVQSGALADLVGSHTWSGKACDGTALSISYDVLAAGTVAYGSATGGTVTVKSRDHGFVARFDATRVKVMVGLRQAKDGTYFLAAAASRGGCLHQQIPNPTVNTPVKAGAGQPADHKGEGSSHGGGHGGGGFGSRGGRH